MLDVPRLVEAALERDSLGQLTLERRHSLVDRVADREHVDAVLCIRGDEHGAPAVVAAGINLLGGVPADVRDVAYHDQPPTAARDDGLLDLVERLVAARGL